MKISVTCNNCNKSFSIVESRFKKNKSGTFYCGKKCFSEYVKPTNNTECYICGKKMYRKQSALVKIKRPCCSKECAIKMKQETYIGKNNHQYGLKGELNKSFISDIRLNTDGYILIRDMLNPFSDKNGFVFLHRKIIEEYLINNNPENENLIVHENNNLYISPNIIVHHKDKNKLNNTIENLETMRKGEHQALHKKNNEYVRDYLGRFVTNTGKTINKNNNLYKKHFKDAGLDIVTSESSIVKAKDRLLISTGLKIDIPRGHVGIIYSRSGLSLKHGIQVGAGCIDEGYNGEVKVLLYNFSDMDFEFKKGDRIAQLLTIPINQNYYNQVDGFDETIRGDKGFGSSGK